MISNLKLLHNRYSESVKIRFFGAFLTSITGAMLAPFLIIYLNEKLDGNLLLLTLIVALQPISDIIFTLVGGGVTDKFGRKSIILFSLFLQALAMAGFMLADSVWIFALLYVLNGIGRSLFIPAQRAQIVDSTENEKRSEVFAIINTVSSLGVTIGPVLGLFIYKENPSLIFGLEALALLIYLVVVWVKTPETAPTTIQKNINNHTEKSVARGILPFFIRHQFVLGMMVFTLPISFFYAQVETNYKIYIQDLFPTYLTILTTLTTAKAIMTMLLQVVLVKWTDKLSMTKIVLISYTCYFVAAIGFGYSNSLVLLLLTQLLVTLGESIGLNHFLRYVSELAPEQNRGLYFSLYGIHWDISRTIGPFIGGLLLLNFGGATLFSIAAIFLIIGGTLQYFFVHYIDRKRKNDYHNKMIRDAC